MPLFVRIALWSVCPALLLLAALLAWRSPRPRWQWLALSFALGALGAAGSMWVLGGLARWLDFSLSSSGRRTSSFLFLFAVAAPLVELVKVLACWPAFVAQKARKPWWTLLHVACAALGYAAVQSALVLALRPSGAWWSVRAVLTVLAQLLFALLWGYGMALAKSARQLGPRFAVGWLLAVATHGFYNYLLAGRGDSALWFAVPVLVGNLLLAAMVLVSVWRFEGDPPPSVRRLPLPAPPTFAQVQAALRSGAHKPRLRWVLYGALMLIGSSVLGFAGATVLGHLIEMDFAAYDEADLASALPLLLLVLGVWAALPIGGFVLAKASEPPNMAEPLWAASLASLLTLLALGMSSTLALVWGVSCAPIGWAFACAGAWLGRPRSAHALR